MIQISLFHHWPVLPSACSLLLLPLLSLLPSQSVFADEKDGICPCELPLHASIPKLTASLHLDGKLDECVWQQAATLGPFYFNDDGEATSELERTTLKIWYDSHNLYLGWTCRDTDIQATFTQRDSKFWEEEVAEFFLAPSNPEQYFELQWNPLNGIFDAIIHNQLDVEGHSKKFTGDWDYTAPNMASQVLLEGTNRNSTDTDSQWTVEVQIPFSDLKLSAPQANDTWRANFYRFNRGKGHEPQKISWSPTLLPSFHEPNAFGYLHFLDGALTKP